MDALEVEELTLDSIHFGKFTKELKEKIGTNYSHKLPYLELFENLCSLTLNDCQLKSLAGFPNLPKLAKVTIINSKIYSLARAD